MKNIFRASVFVVLLFILSSFAIAFVSNTGAGDAYPDKPAPDGYHWCLKNRLVEGINGRPVLQSYWGLCLGSLA